MTLSAGADDIVTFTASGKYLEIVNRDATNALWFCWTKDASTPPLPVAAAAGVEYVGPGEALPLNLADTTKPGDHVAALAVAASDLSVTVEVLLGEVQEVAP